MSGLLRLYCYKVDNYFCVLRTILLSIIHLTNKTTSEIVLYVCQYKLAFWEGYMTQRKPLYFDSPKHQAHNGTDSEKTRFDSY